MKWFLVVITGTWMNKTTTKPLLFSVLSSPVGLEVSAVNHWAHWPHLSFVVMKTLDISTSDLLCSVPRIRGKVFLGRSQFSDKMCQPWLHTEWNRADNITGMSSMENKRNRLQWKTLPSTRVKRRTMCCQRYVILHATRHSARTHLWVHDCRCKNTQTRGDTTVWISP